MVASVTDSPRLGSVMSAISASAAGGAGATGAATSPLAATGTPSAESSHSSCPISIVSPGWATIRASTPADGDGMRRSALSDVTSTISSSSATASPGCLSHSTIVASVTDSPKLGSTTDTLSSGTLLLSVVGG